MLELVELMAVLASASFGILLARSKSLDFVGIFSVAFITAFGGGTLRDLLLNRQPLFWIREEHYAVIVFALAALGSLPFPADHKRLVKFLHVPDAFGLGLFSIVGAGFALDSGTSWFVAALFGVITGTFGGVAGDIICNEIPNLFRTSPLCATCSFAGSWVFILGKQTTVPESVLIWFSIALIVLFRLAAIRWNWVLPSAKYE